MRAWIWLAVAMAGFGVMVLAYRTRPRADPGAPWATGFLIVGPEEPRGTTLPGRSTGALVRLLPGTERVEALLQALEQTKPGGSLELQAQLRPKLILLDLTKAGIGADALASGRLPEPGRDEVIAGPNTRDPRTLEVGGRSLAVVGVLRPELALFRKSYLVPPAGRSDRLFPKGDASVHRAALVRLSPQEFRSEQVLRQLELASPAPKFTRLAPSDRLDRGRFYLYLAGQAVFLAGGSGVLIGLYRWAAARVRSRWLADPLRALSERPALAWGVHLVYFGLVMAGSVFIYELPEIQAVLVASVRGQISGNTGPLAVAGKAYASRNVLRAAAATFAINFPLGTVACITLPSVLIPGAGVAVAALRAVLWGVLLAPTSAMNAWGMMPHSVTMLLEGEGYILATFFALLIPIRLVWGEPDVSLPSRFRRVVLLNIRALVLVALILAVAACYEAVEVIAMMP